MKGIHGLIIAIVLGVIGAAFNLVYLNKGRDFAHSSFIGVRSKATIARGQPIKTEYLAEVKIPRPHVGNLKVYAYPWKDRETIIGRVAIRKYEAGELLLREDFRTAPDKLPLKENDSAIWVPIDTRTTITSQITPGITRVSFYVPRSAQPNAPARVGASWEWLGPFDVLSVGNRFDSPEVMSASKTAPRHEHMLTLRANAKNGKPDRRIAQLLEYLVQTDYQPLRLQVHAPVARNQ
jgi:hypothetical protein